MFMFMLHGIFNCLDVNYRYVGMSCFVMRPTYHNRNCCNFFDAYFIVYINWVGFYCKTLCACLNWLFTQGVKVSNVISSHMEEWFLHFNKKANFVDLIEEIWKWLREQMSQWKKSLHEVWGPIVMNTTWRMDSS